MTLLSLAALPLPVAAAKLEPVRSEVGDADYKIRLVDLSPRFLDFYTAATAPGVDPEQR